MGLPLAVQLGRISKISTLCALIRKARSTFLRRRRGGRRRSMNSATNFSHRFISNSGSVIRLAQKCRRIEKQLILTRLRPLYRDSPERDNQTFDRSADAFPKLYRLRRFASIEALVDACPGILGKGVDVHVFVKDQGVHSIAVYKPIVLQVAGLMIARERHRLKASPCLTPA